MSPDTKFLDQSDSAMKTTYPIKAISGMSKSFGIAISKINWEEELIEIINHKYLNECSVGWC